MNIYEHINIKSITFEELLRSSYIKGTILVTDKQFICKALDEENETHFSHADMTPIIINEANIKEDVDDENVIEILIEKNPKTSCYQLGIYAFQDELINSQIHQVKKMLDEFEEFDGNDRYDLSFNSTIMSSDEIKATLDNKKKRIVRGSQEKIVGETLDTDTIKQYMLENLDIENCSEDELYKKKKVYYEDEFYKKYLLELFPDFVINEHEEKTTIDNKSKTNTGLVFSGNDFGSTNPKDITTNMRQSAIGAVESAIDESRKDEIKQ